MKHEELDVSEILLHLGERDLPFNAVSPPIAQTSIFCFKSYDDFRDALADESSHFLYSRGNNPTVNLCERKIAALEHGERAKLVSSGVAAISCALFAQVKSGDHIVAVENSYSWTKYMLETYLKRFGVEFTYVEGTKIEQFERAIRPNTKAIYLESPATFTFKLQPLKEVAQLAKSKGIKTIIDNSWASPIFQNPLDYGIDLVVHSATKYLGGNSDLVAGVVVGSDEDVKRVFETEFLPRGPAPDPIMAWLLMRNMRNLHVRMPVHFQNALAVATFLEQDERVENVLYPFLPSFPQYALAKEQMRGGSGLFSFRLKTRKVKDVKAFVNSLRLFKRAVSWGGYESLVDPASVKFQDDEPIPDDLVSLVRLHIGLEDKNLLIADLKAALDKIE